MSSPEREGPAAGPDESPDRAKGDGPAGGDSQDTTLVGSPPSGAEKIEDDAKPDASPEVDEDADTKVMSSDAEEDAKPTNGVATASAAADDEVPEAKQGGDEPEVTAETSEPDDTEVDDRARAADDEGTDGVRIRYYGRTDVGLIREHNEDNFLVADLDKGDRDVDDDEVRRTKLGGRGAIFAVCDGMGGAAAGEVASQMAVDTIYEFFTHVDREPRDRDHFARRLVSAIEEAGNRIFSAAKMDRTRRGMGTTATVAGLMDKVLFVGQVGDSRAYILRNGELGLITKDQSLVNQLIEAGQLTDEEAEAFEHSNIILQALGTTEDVTVDLTFLELRRGDRLMLCSDGLSGLVHQEMIKEVLRDTDDLSIAAEKLIEMANAGGGHDNITVVCAEFAGAGLAEPGASDRAVYQQYPLPVSEDEERESLPPRDTHIKEGGRKPGADVKGRSAGDGHAAAAMQSIADEPVRPFSWGLILVVLLLAAVATAVAVAMGGRNDAEAEEDDRDQTSSVAAGTNGTEPDEEVVAEEEDEKIEVRVITDVTGELSIDGIDFGELREGESVYVELMPGAHRFEAIADGNVVTSAIIQLRPGVPADVALTMPTGIAEPEEDGEPAEEHAVPQVAETGGTDAHRPEQTERPESTTMMHVVTEMTTQTTDMQETGGTGTGTTTGTTTGMTGTGTGTGTGTTTTTAMTGTTTAMTSGTGTGGTMMTEEAAPPDNPFE